MTQRRRRSPLVASLLATLLVIGLAAPAMVLAGTATHLLVTTTASDPQTAGVGFDVTVTALDNSEEVDTTYTGTVHFGGGGTAAVLPDDYAFTGGDGGIHTFSGVILTEAGTQTITATDSVTSTITGDATVTVGPATAESLSVTGYPSSTSIGESHGFTVTARDPYGNVASGYRGTVTFTSTDPAADLPDDHTFTGGDNGSSTFSATFNTSGTRSITATDTSDATITGTQPGIIVEKLDQTITFAALGGKTYGDAPFAVSATASSGLTVSFSSLTTAVCTVAGSTVTIVAAGDCTVRASQAGNATWNAATPVDQGFTVAKKAQTITFGTLADKTFDQSPITVTATASSGLPVSFASQTTSVCTSGGTNGATITFVTPGSCTVRASQAGNANWSAAPNVDQDFEVGKGTQTITFAALGGKTYGDAPFAVSATASSGLTVSFSSLTTAVCTVAGSTVTIVAAGDCTVRASQAGNATWNAATPVDQGFTVAKKAQTITFGTLADKTFDQSPITVTATASSGLPVSFASQTTSVCTSGGTNGATITFVTPGSCTVRASQAGNANWSAAPNVDQDFEVGKGTQTITFAALGGKTYGDAPFAVSATASSGLTVSFSSLTTAVCTVAGSTVTIVAAGDCTVRASQAGNATWNAATPVDQGFTVAKKAQTITFGTLADKTFDQSPITVTATASSGLPVSFASQTTSVCTSGGTNGATITFVTPGSCTVRASQAGNANWSAAPNVDQDFEVGKGTQTITFAALGGKTYGDAPFAVSATASSGLTVSFSSLTTAVCTVAGSTVTIVAAGDCTVRASQAGNATWNAATPVDQGFTVAKKAQTITFGTLADKTFDQSPITVTATASSGLPVSFASQTTSVCTSGGTNGATITFVTPGSCTVRASQAGNANWSAAPNVDQDFEVGKGTQTITFAALGGKTYGDAPFAVSATASSGLTVSFSSLTTAVCTVAGSTVTIVAAGDCTVRASQAGNATWNAATPVDQGFTVAKKAQTITFGTLADKTFDQSPITVTATASSGLPVSFASQTTSVCTSGGTNGATITFVTPGSCTVRASQAGNANWSAAPNVDQDFEVGKGTQTITFAALGGKTYGDAPFAVSATASSGLTVSFSSLTTAVCTVAGSTVTIVAAGDCTVRASQAGNATWNAATPVDQGFTVAKKAVDLTANDQSRLYGAADPTFDATFSGLVGADDPGTPDCSTTGETPKVVGGTYPISCTGASLSANYTYTFHPGTLTIQPAHLIVTADSKARQYGLPNPPLTATVSGFAYAEDATSANLTGTADCSTDAQVTDDVGTHAITCTPGTLGAPNYDFPSFVDSTLVITQALAAPAVVADVNPAPATALVTFTATVTWPTGTPTGTVTFFEDATDLSVPVALDGSGKASFETSALPVGAHEITAVYSGDGADFGQATSAAFTQVIGRSAVNVVLAANRTTWETNVPIMFTAALAPDASGVTVPVTGTVSFTVDGVLKATATVADGAATYASPALSTGSHNVIAAYVPDVAGSVNFDAGAPASLTKTVVVNTVSASGVGVSGSTIYPYKDAWRDTVTISGTRLEPLSVTIKIYSPSGKLLSTRTRTNGTGAYSSTWTGRTSSGKMLPAGKYRVVQTLSDPSNKPKALTKSWTSYVTLSTKRMYWYSKTLYVSPGPRHFAAPGDKTIQDQFSTTKTGPLYFSNPTTAPAWLAAGYQFTLPSASTYRSLSFQVKGSWTGTTAPEIGLIPWNGGDWKTAMYSVTRARKAIGTSTASYYAQTLTNLTGIRSGRYVRAADQFLHTTRRIQHGPVPVLDHLGPARRHVRRPEVARSPAATTHDGPASGPGPRRGSPRWRIPAGGPRRALATCRGAARTCPRWRPTGA